MEFEQYYNTLFREHFNQFVSQIPDESKFHDDSIRKKIITIQRERLTNKFEHLNFLSKQELSYFSYSLFFTILTDMIYYSHFKSTYDEFQIHTMYPKLIGDCRTMCRFHLEPSEIFLAIKLDVNKQLFEEASLFFKKYINHLITNNFPMINSNEFWNLYKERMIFKSF